MALRSLLSFLVPSLVVLLPFVRPADGGVWKVDPNGTGNATSVQGAIDLALSGDTVLVAPGTYAENLSLEGKGILVRGESGPGTVVLDGSYAGRVLTVSSPDLPVVLENLDFEYGREQGIESDNQGGGVASFAAHLVIRDCVFRNNLASSLGAGIYVSTFPLAKASTASAISPALEVTRTLFESNFCGGDGGGIFADATPTVIEDCTFRDNTGRATGGGIGFIYRDHSIVGSLFENNHASDGAGVHFAGSGSLRIEGCIFRDNVAEKLGGGCFVFSAGKVDLVRSAFVGNRAVRGAGASFQLVPVSGERIYWLGNVAEERGGGFYAARGSVVLTLTTWLQNQAATGASFTLLDAGLSVGRSILGDPSSSAEECAGASTVTGSCLVAAPAAGGCAGLPISARVSVEACPAALDSLCPVPVLPDCGTIGHADAACGPHCASPARSLTWGRLKDLYR